MNKDKLKKIRWFSNGVWQFQPHLYFLVNLFGQETLETIIAETAPKMERLEGGEVINVRGFYFKLENDNELG